MMMISAIQKICLYLLSFLSPAFISILAKILVLIFFSKKSKKYLITKKNLNVCFPDKSIAWVNKITQKSLYEYARTLLEAPYLYRNAKKNINKLINKVYSENIIDEAVKNGRGIIFMTPHHGSWELSGLFVSSKIKTFTMYKPLKNTILNNFIVSGRKAKGATLVETDANGVKELLKALKNKYAIGILPDHTPKLNQGVMSRFFNVPVNTTTLIYKLAIKDKIPIIYIFSERLPGSKGYNIHVGSINKIFYELDEIKATNLLNKTIEDLVNKNIAQYLWSYERFRNRTGVKENIYN